MEREPHPSRRLVPRLLRDHRIIVAGLAEAVPVDVHRDRLYSPDDVYDASPYAASLDARAYAWSREDTSPEASLARALHDHGVGEALAAWRSEQQRAGRRLVGVMGGHAEERGSEGYARAAQLGWLLGAGHTVTTGGGPGAMEAVNLGAAHAALPAERLDGAIDALAAVPGFRPSVDAWVDSARAVLAGLPTPHPSLGVPTWFYGHEPPNLFATVIAKFFRNALREAILLEICDAGIVVLPGAAGTVQEVFQDACENYYAAPEAVAPMVLVGVEHWTSTLPAWPLLQALARGRAMEPHVHLVDTVEEAAALIGG